MILDRYKYGCIIHSKYDFDEVHMLLKNKVMIHEGIWCLERDTEMWPKMHHSYSGIEWFDTLCDKAKRLNNPINPYYLNSVPASAPPAWSLPVPKSPESSDLSKVSETSETEVEIDLC
jgi:hypothetical protein